MANFCGMEKMKALMAKEDASFEPKEDHADLQSRRHDGVTCKHYHLLAMHHACFSGRGQGEAYCG